ncbi:MAG TPA: hypothetical protein DIT25_02460, partial [Candidatus Moranbacteria bacterium]|nr:hypothetical protein [Candidatus Moranbacteria bacterium]
MIWGTKARDFQSLAGLTHEDVLARMAVDYSLPMSVADSCMFVLRSAHLNPDAAVWMKHVVNVEAWYKGTYVPSVISYLHQHIADDVVKCC